MQKAVIFLLMFLMFRCSPKLSADASWKGGKWVLMEMNGVPVQVSGTDKDAHLVFSPSDKKYSGSSGCNRLMGNYTVGKNGIITFGTPAGTRMTCMDQRFEDAFMKIFPTVNRYSVEGKTMLLKNGNMVVMKLERVGS